MCFFIIILFYFYKYIIYNTLIIIQLIFDIFEFLVMLLLQVDVYMVSLFEDANLAAIHANRITVRPSDMQFVQKIRKS